MIAFLSNVGRAFTSIGAIVTVSIFVFLGYSYGLTQPTDIRGTLIFPFGGISIVALVCTLLGTLLGLIVAGAIFGTIATLYDIRDNLRLLVQSNGNGSSQDTVPEYPPGSRARRDPYIGGEATREST